MTATAHYEVLLVPSAASPTASEWTWRRLESDDSVSALGLRHASMNACFAEVRQHKGVFGDAAVCVNLRGEAAPCDERDNRPVDGATPARVPRPGVGRWRTQRG